MKKEIYEAPRVEIVELGARNAMCDNVICSSMAIEKGYTGFGDRRYNNDDDIDENGVIDYGTGPFNSRNF